MTDRVVVGRIGKAHGLRGEVYVEPHTDEPDRRYADGQVLRAVPPPERPAGDLASLTVTASRWHQGRLLVCFAEIAERTTAETARNTVLEVAVDPAERPADPEEYYDHQLTGLRVARVGGGQVGTVREVLHSGAQDLLVIDRDAGGDALVPFVAALVPEVDLEAGVITVDDRPGLLEDR